MLLIALMFLGQAMSAQTTGGSANYRVMLPGAVMYGILAVTFVWLGVGSIQCRRWARALVLILSWSWLFMGVASVVLSVFLLPKVLDSLPNEEAKTVALVVAMGILIIMFVFLPLVLVFFYQNKNVKATCENRDPVIRWTDNCPLPVLALSIWLGFDALALLAVAAGYRATVPFFGILFSGLPGTLIYLFLTALWTYLAWAFYRLKSSAWWSLVVVLVLVAASNIITFTQIDLMELYRQMGYPKEQIEQMQKLNFINSTTMVWWSIWFLPPIFGYLIWIKRFFPLAHVKAVK